MAEPLLPEIPVRVVYLGQDDSEDREFETLCVSVPRMGERIDLSGETAEVTRVYHRFIKNPAMSREQFTQYITVVCRSVPEAAE